MATMSQTELRSRWESRHHGRDVDHGYNTTSDYLKPPFLGDGPFNLSVICRDSEFYTNVFVLPMSENILRSFFSDCLPDDTFRLSENWTLCGPQDTYMCSDIQTYAKSCQETKTVVLSSCDDVGYPVGLLVGLTLTGFLLGLITMAIVCLLLPRLRRLCEKTDGNKHLPPNRHLEINGNNRESTRSEQYIDIDQHGGEPVPLHERPATTDPSLQLNSAIQQPTYHRINDGREEESVYTVPGEEPYEPLKRSGNQQSHKYAALEKGGVEPEIDIRASDGEDDDDKHEDHSYFVLQKRT